jgi:hypothetical protein
MNSLKAIISGVVFIIVAILLMQLAYLLISVASNSFAKTYPFLNEIPAYFPFLITIPVFVGIMFTGGYLTAVISQQKAVLHTTIVGLLTTGGMMWLALENAELTTRGIVINLVLLGATILGGVYQEKRSISRKNNPLPD